MKKGEQPPKALTGSVGDYKVQLLLARPGYPNTTEREQSFIDEKVGDSHVVIAKPKSSRTPQGAVQVLLHVDGDGRRLEFKGLPNDKGYLGKFVAERLPAKSFNDAEASAYRAITPFLSAWSVHLDIPMHVETIQVTEISSGLCSLRVATPHSEMTFGGGVSPLLSNDFCQYASIYREGMNTNSAFYRFLCFYKIIESIPHRRSREREAARVAGRDVPRFTELIPADEQETLSLLGDVYPWRGQWDKLSSAQLIPTEAKGKKFGAVREQHLSGIRTGIAHALLKTGEITISLDNLEHIQQVNKWLPLTRMMARLVLRNEFPREFAFLMDPVFAGLPQV